MLAGTSARPFVCLIAVVIVMTAMIALLIEDATAAAAVRSQYLRSANSDRSGAKPQGQSQNKTNNKDDMTGKRIVVMVRHGESEMSKNNIFCGWYDSNLSDRGVKEAIECAELLKEGNYQFDRAYTSLLHRAHQTLNTIAAKIGQPKLPRVESWKLNERHYGALTGCNKAELAATYGEEQVQIWRRSFDVLPPPMEKDHKYYWDIRCNPKIKAHNNSSEKFPSTESLKETMERVIPYWKNNIASSIRRGQRILIVAHGTVLRSLIKHLEGISDKDICSINIPSGIPFFYEFGDDMKVISARTFLGDKKRLEEGIARAASIGSH